ncbi:MAG TPA: DUF3311 domain-containing protein [Candidatus Tyrphobacter sp.]
MFRPAILPAAVPILALTIAVPFVNRLAPSIFGLPFVLFWIVMWVLLTPASLWLVGRLEHRW